MEQEEDDLGVPSEEEAAQMEWEESFRSHDDTNPRSVPYWWGFLPPLALLRAGLAKEFVEHSFR